MKEHSLFLEAGFTPPNADFAARAEWFKAQFESLLADCVRLSNRTVRQQVLDSNEIVTPFTLTAEHQTQRFTGIGINSKITMAESQLQGINSFELCNGRILRQVEAINRRAMGLLDGLIAFKKQILKNVRRCNMFTMNYPLLIEHILREAKLYRSYVTALENGTFTDQYAMDTEHFWNQIMMEHAMFIRGLLDPSEAELIDASDAFAKEYAELLKTAREQNDFASSDCTDSLRNSSLAETLRFRDFKQAGTSGIQNCEIESVILPLLADHVLREANHYIRLLKTKE